MRWMKLDYILKLANIQRPDLFFLRADTYVRSHFHIRGGQTRDQVKLLRKGVWVRERNESRVLGYLEVIKEQNLAKETE